MANDPISLGEVVDAVLNGTSDAYARLAPVGQNGPNSPNSPNSPNGHKPARFYGWNDNGNGQRLLDDGGRERLIYVQRNTFPWHMWDDNCWEVDRTQRVPRWMERVLFNAYVGVWNNGQPRAAQSDEAKWLSQSNDTKRIDAALRAASRSVTQVPEIFDTHDWYLPCNNGMTYDMETGKVIKSLPEHYMSRCVPVPAVEAPGAHPKFDAVLALVTGDNHELASYLRLLLGLCLTGYVGEKSFWFLQGNTDAGKTTLLKLLAVLGGPYVYNIPLRGILRQRGGSGILHDIAGTEGMRLVYAEEFKLGDVLDSEWVKKISGGGDISADKKGENNRTFRSTAKLMIGTNDMPDITDIDDAIRGRVRVVPFPTDIPRTLAARGEKVRSVEAVVGDLMTEAPSILYTLVHDVAAWRAAGRKLVSPAVVAEASKVYLDKQDPLVEWMEVCCAQDENGIITKTRVELPFETWYWSFLLQSGKAHSKALRDKFGTMLVSKGFTKRAAYNGKYYTGPALTIDARVEAEKQAAWMKLEVG